MDLGSSFLSPIFHWLTGSLGTWPKVPPLIIYITMNLHSWFHIPIILSLDALLWSCIKSGSRDIARRLQFCDCVIEVHDARVSSHSKSNTPHLFHSFKITFQCISITPIPISHSLVVIPISNSCSEEDPSCSSWTKWIWLTQQNQRLVLFCLFSEPPPPQMHILIRSKTFRVYYRLCMRQERGRYSSPTCVSSTTEQ